MKKLIALMFASSVILLMQTPLQAAEIKTAHSMVLRGGPGLHYAAQQKITAKTPVHIGVCNPAWCHIRAGKQSGWVETGKLMPNLAKTVTASNQMGNRSTANGIEDGGTGKVSRVRRPHASTNMVVRMRIISKEEAAARQKSR